MPPEKWGALRLDTDFTAKTWTLLLDGKPLKTLPLDPEKAVFDGLKIAVSSGAVSIDNINVDWAWEKGRLAQASE